MSAYHLRIQTFRREAAFWWPERPLCARTRTFGSSLGQELRAVQICDFETLAFASGQDWGVSIDSSCLIGI